MSDKRKHGIHKANDCDECRRPASSDSYDAARKVIPSIKAGREHAAYEIGLSEGRKQSRDEVAALRAELEQTTDERNALLHARTALRAELAGWQTTAQQYEEIVRTTEAELERVTTELAETRDAVEVAVNAVGKANTELERVTTERDAAIDLLRKVRDEEHALGEHTNWLLNEVIHPTASYGDYVRWHDEATYGEHDAEVRRVLGEDDPDARVATSEQEASRCSCGKPERGRGPWHSPGRCALYAGALDLPIEASEQEASDCTTCGGTGEDEFAIPGTDHDTMMGDCTDCKWSEQEADDD